MSKVLGLDLGTNSVGWAIVEKDGDSTRLLDYGTHIFQEGVNRVKGNEEPKVKTRTDARSSRRHYFRRRLRKIELLKILVEKSWCPYISPAEFDAWRRYKEFPLRPDFLEWLRTDDASDCNPYHDRHRCLHEALDFNVPTDRYTFGRALYHINQRRGFLSNRKDQSSDDETGKVKASISELDSAMKEAGYDYLGDYFYHLYSTGQTIRGRYTDRICHYVKEFREICRVQCIDEYTAQRLYEAIFYQRPLKSQKGLVGKCPFEKGKTRCQLSHPDFEEFRMLSFVNNIRIAYPGDSTMRPLTRDEKALITPLFYRKSKPDFDFADIRKKFTGRGGKSEYLSADSCGNVDSFRFNFRDTTNVSGCPVTSQLMSIFGEDWKNSICEQYTLSGGKSKEQIINDVWHALFFYDNEEMLVSWAKEKLQLDDDSATSFAGIRLPQGYAALSRRAISKILPWLREGYRYDEAVFLANLPAVLEGDRFDDAQQLAGIEKEILDVVKYYVPDETIKNDSKQRRIEEILVNLGIEDKYVCKLYHPSMVETYPQSQPDRNGMRLLQSPRVESIRNPMAMRALFRLRSLVNTLIKEGKVDSRTKVNIELSRNLNDHNLRRAIEIIQSSNQKKREYIEKEIAGYYSSAGFNACPSERDILKYELWEEQKHKCLYTGRNIGLSDFLGANPLFDIEHTVPRSRGGDDSKANKTLCENRFNREIKKGHLPSELVSYDEIISYVELAEWEKKIEDLRKEIARASRVAKSASTKDVKDRAIQKRHVARMELEYFSDKLRRFKLRDVPEGFTNRQGVDIGIIGRYARLYMKSVFDKVYTVKGETTSEFRKLWGLQDNYSKKERVNHSHHCIDAITIACIGKVEYDQWAQYKRDEELCWLSGKTKPSFPKPWTTFTEDVKGISESLLISHHTADNMCKQTRKKFRVNGVIQRNENGEVKYIAGDSARCSLHQQTFYGAICKNDEIRYVVRKELASLAEKDVEKIVDDVVREKVMEVVRRDGIKALQGTVWMNEEKQIPIRKVRLYASVTNPLVLKEQRFKSAKDYKQNYYVANDGNYAIAIYEGVDKRNKKKRSFKIVNNLEAAKCLKSGIPVIPDQNEEGYRRLCTLKTGTMVLFYEEDAEEVRRATKQELSRRLYKVTGLSISRVQQYEYGMITLLHHQESRAAGDIQFRKGPWLSQDGYRAKIELNHNQFKALVEGCDFEMNALGEISFI